MGVQGMLNWDIATPGRVPQAMPFAFHSITASSAHKLTSAGVPIAQAMIADCLGHAHRHRTLPAERRPADDNACRRAYGWGCRCFCSRREFRRRGQLASQKKDPQQDILAGSPASAYALPCLLPLSDCFLSQVRIACGHGSAEI
jgi:hypothetical protein